MERIKEIIIVFDNDRMLRLSVSDGNPKSDFLPLPKISTNITFAELEAEGLGQVLDTRNN